MIEWAFSIFLTILFYFLLTYYTENIIITDIKTSEILNCSAKKNIKIYKLK